MKRAVDLGIYQRRMRMKYPVLDLSFGNFPTDETDLEQFLLHALKERLPDAESFVAMLESLEESHFGTVLSPQLLLEIDVALGIQVMPYWVAGVYEELTGTNPLADVRAELRIHQLESRPAQAERAHAPFLGRQLSESTV